MPADTTCGPEGWADFLRRVLVVRLDNIGDVVMLGPALRTLRQALPRASITLLASPAGSQVAELLPWVDDVITLRAVWQDASQALPLDPGRELQLVESLRSGQFDAALIFTSFSQSAWPPAYACYLAGIPIRMGQARDFGGSLLTRAVMPLPDAAHQVDRNLHLLESAGFTVTDRRLELKVSPELQRRADEILRAHSVPPEGRFILLAPGASCAARRYDLDRYTGVARMLGQVTRLPMVVAGSAREAELVQPILVDAPRYGIVSLVGQTSIQELAAVVRRASLVIANDSGPMHLAEAFLRPMVILYSGTEYESQWCPRYAPARILRRPTACSPCYGFTCAYAMECLDIPVEEVVSEALDLLNGLFEDEPAEPASRTSLAERRSPARRRTASVVEWERG